MTKYRQHSVAMQAFTVAFFVVLILALVFVSVAWHKHSIESTCNIHISWAKAIFWNSRLARCQVGN